LILGDKRMSMSEMRPFFQYAAGILLTVFYVGAMVWLTWQIYKYATPDMAPAFSLAAWIGGAMPLIGIWSAIRDSTGGFQIPLLSKPFTQHDDTAGRRNEGTASAQRKSEGSSQSRSVDGTIMEIGRSIEKKKDEEENKPKDFAYRGEYPKRKRKGFDY
jgi:hypothetical protein